MGDTSENASPLEQPALEQVLERVKILDDVAAQLEALEEDKRHSRDVITELVKGSQRTVAHLDRLSAQLGPLQAVPKRVAAVEAAQGRLSAVEKAMAGLARRVTALEQAGDRPSEKLLSSITKRLDRLSTHAALAKELPDRLDALERSAAGADPAREAREAREGRDRLAAQVYSLGERMDDVAHRLASLEQALAPGSLVDQTASRSETLSRGLSGAIDLIDQLSHQVTLLEHTVQPSEQAGPAAPGAPT